MPLLHAIVSLALPASLVAQVQLTPPQCGDYVSYALLPDGSCIDMGSFSEMGALERELESLQREVSPIVSSAVELRQEEYADYISATLTNQSSIRQRVFLAHFGVFRRVDGRTVREGGQSVGVNAYLDPGQSYNVDVITYQDYHPDAFLRLESIDSLPE